VRVDVRVVAVLLDRLRSGVTYSARDGGVCPMCGHHRCRIYRSLPWESGSRVRYHRCPSCGASFKSVDALGDHQIDGSV